MITLLLALMVSFVRDAKTQRTEVNSVLTTLNLMDSSTGAEPAVVSVMKTSASVPAFSNQMCGRCGWPYDCHGELKQCHCTQFMWVKKHYDEAAIAAYKHIRRIKWQFWVDHMIEDM